MQTYDIWKNKILIKLTFAVGTLTKKEKRWQQIMKLKTKKANVNKHLYGERLIGKQLITTRKHDQAKPP